MVNDTVHYNIDNILNKNTLFNLIFGEKSGGKSYQAKTKLLIKNYLVTGKRFILLRRWRDEIKNLNIEKYFSDIDIQSFTGGKYDSISSYRGEIFFSKYDSEKCKCIRCEKIGYAIALSQEQNFSSVSFLDVNVILFEEFMSRTNYLANECEKLMIFYDTVDRKRGACKLWLLGNTISRACPYITKWSLLNTINNMPKGSIVEVPINDNLTLSIEYCMPTGQTAYALGDSVSMIEGGDWLSNPQPTLSFSYKNTYIKKILTIVIEMKTFKFLARLFYNKLNRIFFWLIVPKRNSIKKNTIVVTDTVRYGNRFLYTNIYNININDKILNLINATFIEKNIFYSDDITGTEFKNVINFQIRR